MRSGRVVPVEEFSLVFHEVDGVTTGGNLGGEFVILELISVVFSTAGGLSVSSKGSNITEGSSGTSNVLIIS